jgi:hypothetical protein
MDPITIASKRFHTEYALFWEPPPGHEVRGPLVLRIEAEHAHRADALKSLRLIEWKPENRHPFVIVEGTFASAREYIGVIARKLHDDYGKLAKGLAEDGLTIGALGPLVRPVRGNDLMNLIRHASSEVSKVLAGLTLVLMPERITDAKGYAECLSLIAPIADGAMLRVAVQSEPEIATTYPGAARFLVDDRALLDHLKNLGKKAEEGPPTGKPRPTPEQRAAAEKAAGKPILSEGTGNDLRALLLDAGDAFSKSQFKTAAKKFRAARMLCHLTGLKEEEAMASIALGSALLATGDKVAAIAAYRAGKQIALSIQKLAIAAQAELGVAAIHFFATEYRSARASYADIMHLAADIPPLRLEAMRMEGECYLAEARTADAITSLGVAVDTAAALPPDVRKMTSYAHAGKTLVGVLDRAGEPARARATEKHLEALAKGAAEVVS